MKSILSAALLAGAALVCFADFDPTNVFLVGKTNKSALSYKPGEEMIYTFKAELGNQKADGLFLRWVRKGDDGVKMSGKVPADQTAVVKTKLDKPGFVSVDVFLVDQKGKVVQQEYKDWSRKTRKRSVAYFVGTAVEPETLTDCGEPADFDAFWAKQKKRLAAVPFKDKVTLKKIKTVNKADIYAVSIPCAGPRPVTGYLNVPVNAKPKSLPAQISFHGYGNHIHRAPGWGSPGRLTLDINAHGQELGKDDAYYKKFFESIRSNGKSYAFDPKQNADPETAFFNGMALRVMRALEYLKSRPEWNGKDLIVTGGSQGGFQAIAAAGLDSSVTLCRVSIPWLCNLGANQTGMRGGWTPSFRNGLRYFDSINFGRRTCNVYILK